jgi:hypothetical protein
MRAGHRIWLVEMFIWVYSLGLVQNILVGSYLITYRSPQARFGLNINFHTSLALKSLNSDDMEFLSIQDEIQTIVDELITMEKKGLDLMSAGSGILIDNGHILAKAGIYEDVVENRMNLCKTKTETDLLTKVDGVIRGYVQSERRSRARLKVNYILAGATSGRLDEAIEMLADAEEIDDDLFMYLDTLIQRELVSKRGPTATKSDEDIKALTVAGKSAVEILQLVRKRLEAEVTTKANPEIRLLGKLINEPDVNEREHLLRTSFKKVEEIENFMMFLDSALLHMTSRLVDVEENQSKQNKLSGSNFKSENMVGSTVEIVKDIQVSLRDMARMLQTGLKEQDVFSTSAMNYLDPKLESTISCISKTNDGKDKV